MKTLIVLNSISGGGAESSMRTINKSLRDKGFDSTIVCLNNAGGDIALDGEIILSRAWKSGIKSTFINFLDFIKVYSKIRPDVVIANCELPELYVALNPIRTKRLICVEHSSKSWAGRRPLGAIVRVLLLFRRTFWVTVNREKLKIWPLNISATFIPNPVEVPSLSIDNAESNPFVFVGRIREEKGIRLVLEAISKANQRISIYGYGELEEELRKKYSNCADFHGFVENPWNQISRSQTIIVASEYEGDGIVVVEAILAGAPILLRDNVDLRRFGLDESSYFSSVENLCMKIKKASLDANQLRPVQSLINNYIDERKTSSVVAKWQYLLGEKT
jgi:glycosyltransferase involved in cell wall biosynthesis